MNCLTWWRWQLRSGKHSESTSSMRHKKRIISKYLRQKSMSSLKASVMFLINFLQLRNLAHNLNVQLQSHKGLSAIASRRCIKCWLVGRTLAMSRQWSRTSYSLKLYFWKVCAIKCFLWAMIGNQKTFPSASMDTGAAFLRNETVVMKTKHCRNFIQTDEVVYFLKTNTQQPWRRNKRHHLPI